MSAVAARVSLTFAVVHIDRSLPGRLVPNIWRMFHLILSWSHLHSGSSVRYCGRCRWCRYHRHRPWRWRCRCHASRVLRWTYPRQTHFGNFGSASPFRFRGHCLLSVLLAVTVYRRHRRQCRCRDRIRARENYFVGIEASDITLAEVGIRRYESAGDEGSERPSAR